MSAATLMWLFGPCVLMAQIACFHILCQIERNTRPPEPGLKGFIKANTKGDRNV